MLLDVLAEAGLNVAGVGKIPDIFLNRGITRALDGHNNTEALQSTVVALRESAQGLIFTNLVDFDMLYGHRLDIDGYGYALEQVDAFLPTIIGQLRPEDLLIITADHGCDPLGPSTDHSREYVPILATGPAVRHGANLGTRSTLADIGQTIADNFGLKISRGESFLKELLPR
jgi:phosphopentomutase